MIINFNENRKEFDEKKQPEFKGKSGVDFDIEARKNVREHDIMIEHIRYHGSSLIGFYRREILDQNQRIIQLHQLSIYLID